MSRSTANDEIQFGKNYAMHGVLPDFIFYYKGQSFDEDPGREPDRYLPVPAEEICFFKKGSYLA
jgi:hypothetical protein